MDRELKHNYLAIKKKIIDICKSNHIDAESIVLVAVSKKHGAEKIKALYDLGHRDFGENYAQELFGKAEQLKGLKDIRWHFIGTLQSNKIKKLAPICHAIHTVASSKHATLINEIAEKLSLGQKSVFINVNAGEETSKSGMALNACEALVEFIRKNCVHLELKGLMAIPPPLTASQIASQEIPGVYKNIADINKSLNLKHLSLGMSDDLQQALTVGSTHLRIGTALFGPRNV